MTGTLRHQVPGYERSGTDNRLSGLANNALNGTALFKKSMASKRQNKTITEGEREAETHTHTHTHTHRKRERENI